MQPTMRQAVIVAPDRFEVRVAPRPALPGPDEVIVRTSACGICSGDLMPWYLAKKVGTVFGHEPVGYAVEVGPGVPHIHPGDSPSPHHHSPSATSPEGRRGAAAPCTTCGPTRLDPAGMADSARA